MSEPAPKKAASVYANERFICLQTQSGYRGTKADPAGALLFFSPHESSEKLGAGLLEALSVSRMIGLDEIKSFFDLNRANVEYEKWVQTLISRFGYGSRRALFKDMKSCIVRSVNGMITISPTRHEKLEAWGGTGLKGADDVLVPEAATTRDIGEAVKLALSRCV